MDASAILDGDEVVVNGRKWWTSGVGHPDCRVLVFMGRSVPEDDTETDRHRRHTMVLVPLDAPGVKVERLLTTMGVQDEPVGHAEVSFDQVRVPRENVLLGEGRAFEIAQGRLGPGPGAPLHAADRAGRGRPRAGRAPRAGPPGVRQARSSTSAATASASPRPGWRSTRPGCWCSTPPGSSTPPGPAHSLGEVSQIKVVVPRMAQDVIDMAMQLHGGGGLSDDFPLAGMWTTARALRLADGPDEVHRGVVARLELAKHRDAR